MEASFWDGKRAPGVADNVDVTQYNAVVEVIVQIRLLPNCCRVQIP